MRTTWPLLGAITLIALAYVGDGIVDGILARSGEAFDSRAIFLAEGAGRFVVAIWIAWLGWLLVRGPRHVAVAAGMLLLGLYFSLVPPVSMVLLVNTEIGLPPFAVEVYEAAAGLMLWSATGVAILGAVALLWPSPAMASPTDPPNEGEPAT